MLLLGLTSAIASPPHYARVQFRMRATGANPGQIEKLQAFAATRAERAEVSLRFTTVDQPIAAAAEADMLRILNLVLDDPDTYRGAELDLFVGPRGGRVPITIAWNDRTVEVARGEVYAPTWERTSRGIVAGRYALASVEDGSRPWTRPLLGMVERAFERLSEPERAVLVDMRLRAERAYVPATGEPVPPFQPGAAYDALAHEIVVFDASFGPSFVGTVHDPEPIGTFTLLHEVAHAIDASAAGDPPSEVFARELADVRVTAYAGVSAQEAFAEAFALWRTDPEALARIAPDAVRFFEEERHLNATALTDVGPQDTGDTGN